MNLIAQASPYNFWNAPSGSSELFIKLLIGLVVGIVAMVAVMKVPAQLRRPIVGGLTFLAGLVYVLYYLWPQPIAREAGQLPRGPIEAAGFWIEDTIAVVGNFANILTAFLLGLGVYSILRIHVRRLAKQQQDWLFSGVLLGSMLLMIIFGYADWYQRIGAAGPALASPKNWGFVQYTRDLLFDGLLQQMDAGMFSIIAFYILSAAYRAFRIRSVEATILLATALIVMLSLMGAVEFVWNSGVNNMAHNDPNSSLQNLQITNIAGWLRETVQTPSLRGIDFGVGIGALAMGLRLWLSLEKGGVGN